MKTLCLHILILMPMMGYSQVDSTATTLDSLSWIWPFSGQMSTRGWEPKSPDPDFERFVKRAASEINKNWNPDFIKVCRCSGTACPEVRYVGTSKYVTNAALPLLYLLYYDAGYNWIKRTWTNDSLTIVLHGLIAHEICHIAHHHPWLREKPTRELESAADYFCGKIMYNVWKHSEAEAVFAISELATISETASYHSRERRVRDVRQGYLDAKEDDERGSESEKKSTLVAVENARKNIFKSVNEIEFNTEIFRDSVGFIGSTQPKIFSSKQVRNDSLTIIFYEDSYRLCVISKRSGSIVQLGTIVPSGRVDYPYVIYDRTFHYWYMTSFIEGSGYFIYAFDKNSERRQMAQVVAPMSIDFGFD